MQSQTIKVGGINMPISRWWELRLAFLTKPATMERIARLYQTGNERAQAIKEA